MSDNALDRAKIAIARVDALRRTKGRAKAVADKCKDCAYDPLDRGTWRAQVGACTIDSCALWPFRPLARGQPRRPRGMADDWGIAEQVGGLSDDGGRR